MKIQPRIVLSGVTVERSGQPVLRNVGFEIESGTLAGVVGPNGAGKTTLFEAITGRVPLAAGTVSIQAERSIKNGGLAYVPQRDHVNWRFPATVHDVVMMGRTHANRWFRRYGKKDHDAARSGLERVDMWDERSSLITELSGGQRERVFVARALAQEASVLLLDEAFSGVDLGAQEALIDVLRSLRDEGRVILLATHDLTNLAMRFDVVLCINGHVCAFGPPNEAFTPAVLEELYGSHGVLFAPRGADGAPIQ